ncbi:MAG: sodium:solute symporter family protein [Polyangiaceae bacterium]
MFSERPLVWALFAVYMVATGYLAWRGHKKTTDIASFSVGSGDLPAWVVGITLAASIASTATFVINPGFVYVHGLSAIAHLGIAAGGGIVVGLFALSFGFRRFGEKVRALTLPQWMSERFGSRGLRTFFALVNLLSLSFVVLIIGGISIVMQQTLGLSNQASLLLTVVFVFSYVFVGGTYAHAYTNTLQGIVMVAVGGLIVASGFKYLSGGTEAVSAALAAQDPNLVTWVNAKSPLFGSTFSVWVSGFLIGFALVCQPHILTKALYVKTDREVRRYLGVCVAVSLVFTALLLVGIYARLMNLPAEAFVNPATGAFSQDRVMAVYLAKSFGPASLAVVTVALLAAGMSTLDGILVALSSIAAHDLFTPLAEKRFLAEKSAEQRAHIAHRASQVILVLIGIAAFAIALHPPKLLGIFGMVGVYGIVAASAVPIAGGIFVREMSARSAWISAVSGLGVHFALYLLATWATGAGHDVRQFGWLSWALDSEAVQGGLLNPAVTATYGLITSAAMLTLSLVSARALSPRARLANSPLV